MGAKITKVLKQEISVDLEPEEMRSLVFQLSVKDQLAIVAAITNKFDRESFISLAGSEQMQLKLWLKNILNTIEI